MTLLTPRQLLAMLATVVAMMTIAPHADAAAGVEVRIREAVLEPDGGVRLTVSVSGATTEPTFTVREQAALIQGVAVTPLSRAQTGQVAVALALDVSGSTAGRPIADAKAAAKVFVSGLPDHVRVALIAFGPRASVQVGLTTDRANLLRAIDGLQAAGGTALYDAVALAAQTLARAQAQPTVVVFSDGGDTASARSLASAVAAAKAARAPVSAIGLRTKDYDASALRALAQGTGGRVVDVAQSSHLGDAFTAVARDIASQYVLAYTSAAGGSEVEISVETLAGGVRASDRIVALSPRIQGPAAPAPAVPRRPGGPLIPVFSSKTGLYVGLAATFAALLALLAVLLFRPSRGEALTVLQRGLRLYTTGGERDGKKRRRRSANAGESALARRASEMLDRVPKPAGYEERLQALLDRAAWPFRAAEFVALRAAAAIAGAVLGGGLFGSWWLAGALGMVGAVLPKGLLKRRVSKRQAAFLGQLPDTLQLLAGSLQAGYGFLQAIDTLVKEAPPPTSGEFNRVLTETRLGMPVDDALNAMAERLGSEDFRWVVLAINIQRQVGGNLAVLLHTVAETLRDRDRVRRQVQVLSAEGKLSAYILGSLPFGIAGYIMMVNPGFLQTMTSEPIGRAMIGGSLFMLGVGILWMRKLIRIEV